MIFFLSTILTLSASDWNFATETRGYKIYTREIAGTDIRGVKAIGTINISMPNLMAHLADVTTSNDWTPNQVKKEIIESKSVTKALTYSVSKMPWPLKDREMVTSNELVIDKQKKLFTVASISISHEKYAKNDKYIRAKVMDARFSFRPIDKHKTHVDVAISMDPAGYIPSWIINYFQRRWPVNWLEAIQQHGQKNKLPIDPKLYAILQENLTIWQKDPALFDHYPKKGSPNILRSLDK